jgi:hypothetical protein
VQRQRFVILSGLLALLGALFVAVPEARAEATRVAVLEFDGPSAAPVRKDVVKSLSAQHDLKVLSSKQVDAASRKLGASVYSSSGLTRIAQQLHVSAFVRGEITKAGKKGFQVELSVVDGKTGQPVDTKSWTRKKNQVRKMGAPSLSFLRGAIDRTSPPPKTGAIPAAESEDVSGDDADEPEEADDDEPVAAPPKRREPTPVERDEPVASQEEGESPSFEDEPKPAGERSAKHPALVVMAGLRTMWRNLSYSGGNTTLSSYENAGGSPAVNAALSAQWYPGASYSDRWYSNVGLDLDFDYAIGLKSKESGKTYSTTAYEAGVGLIGRLPFKFAEPRLRVGYVKQVFDADVPSTTQLPAVAYSALRFGAGTALFLGDMVTADVGVAYLAALSLGELDSDAYAKGASAGAIEVGAGLLVAFKEGVYGVRLGVDYRRWALDFGDASSRAATLPDRGADSFLRTTLSFVYRMPGIRAK